MRAPFEARPGKDNLPPQLTSFIGRTGEISEITGLLIDSGCRLLTLIGLGGVGKTRLAIQVAAELAAHFAHGVYFIPLQSIHDPDFLIPAIADALDLPLTGQENQQVQLFNYLRVKQTLLALDNFEQLLSPPGKETKDGVELFSKLLAAAPGVKLLVTSREVLNLQEEWLFEVKGLPFPPSSPANEAESQAEVENYSAVQLFVERARRVRQDFSLAAEQAGVVRICQLVEGIPLALELAAAWTRTLPCEGIAAEIGRNVDFLATNLRNVPERQRSIRAVFDHSWQLLTEKERNVFKRLSVFRDGFRQEAAEQVAGASLAVLALLVDKSLLRGEPERRYQIHELLRQYAAEQLVLSPEEVAQTYELHCAYYTDFLGRRQEHLWGGRQLEAVAEIAAELENIRVAWQWAVEMVNVAALQKANEVLSLFLQFQGRYLEVVLTFQKAAERLRHEPATPQIERALARILISLSWSCIRLGRLEEAEAAAVEARALCGRLNISSLGGYANHPLLPLGIVASIWGDYNKMARLGEEARQDSLAQQNLWNLQIAYYLLARAALLQGQYEAAQQYAQQAYVTTQTTQDSWFRAYCLTELGNVACALGDYPAAKEHYQASYCLREAFSDPEGMAMALNRLGEIALWQGDYQEARRLYQQSRAIYQKISDRGGLATSLTGLGQVAVVLGDYPAAQQQFQQALQLAVEIQYVPLILSLLIGVGELLLRAGRAQRGAELLAAVTAHPGSNEPTRARVRQLLAHYKIENPSKEEPSTPSDLEATIALLQTELARPVEPEGQRNREENLSPAPLLPCSPALLEPLSERELEVLHLIAAGLQNQEIATELVVALSTVKTHINNIYRKLDVSNRVQAVSQAKELKLL